MGPMSDKWHLVSGGKSKLEGNPKNQWESDKRHERTFLLTSI